MVEKLSLDALNVEAKDDCALFWFKWVWPKWRRGNNALFEAPPHWTTHGFDERHATKWWQYCACAVCVSSESILMFRRPFRNGRSFHSLLCGTTERRTHHCNNDSRACRPNSIKWKNDTVANGTRCATCTKRSERKHAKMVTLYIVSEKCDTWNIGHHGFLWCSAIIKSGHDFISDYSNMALQWNSLMSEKFCSAPIEGNLCWKKYGVNLFHFRITPNFLSSNRINPNVNTE